MFKVSDSTAVTIENPCKALTPSRYFLLQHQHDNRLSLEHFRKMGLNAQKFAICEKIKWLRGGHFVRFAQSMRKNIKKHRKQKKTQSRCPVDYS